MSGGGRHQPSGVPGDAGRPAVSDVPEPVVVAAFDFDETITHRDSVIPFLRRVAGDRRLALGLLGRLHRLVPAALRRDRNAIRAVATEVVFRGLDSATVDRHAAEFGRHLVGSALRDDVVARIRWHLAEGHRVVIVSASYEHYVRVVADELGVHGVAATRLEVDGHGRCTGRLLGPNCRAEEKVVRLDAWLAEHGLERASLTLWAYGDSAGDRELLAAAHHPIWVAERLDSVSATS